MGATFQFTNVEKGHDQEVIVMLDKLFLLEIDTDSDGAANVLMTGNGGMGKFKLSADSLVQLKQAVGCSSK